MIKGKMMLQKMFEWVTVIEIEVILTVEEELLNLMNDGMEYQFVEETRKDQTKYRA